MFDVPTPIPYKQLAADVSMPEPLVRLIIEAHATKKGEPEPPQESNRRGTVMVFPAMKNAS
jgi:hypothetical protein